MQRITLLLLVLLHFVPSWTLLAAGKKIDVKVTDGQNPLITASVALIDDKAYEFESDLDSKILTIYDLSKRNWTEQDGVTTVSLDKAVNWAYATRQKAEDALKTQTDEAQAGFISSMLRPNLKLQVFNGAIHFTNAAVNYTIEGWLKPDTRWLSLFYAYDELNAYRKAMMGRRLPPFPQIEVSNMLKQKGVFPTSMKITLRYPQKTVSLQVNVELHDLTESEIEKIKKKAF